LGAIAHHLSFEAARMRAIILHRAANDLAAFAPIRLLSGMRAKRTQMADKVVTLRLNQQQLELIDRTIATGVAPDRVALIRLALREQAAKRAARIAQVPR
jgi:hypothetical protein